MALTLRTDDELDDALTALSEIEGTSRQDVIRRAVLDRLARTRHSAVVGESAARLREHWSSVLERLGSA